MSASSGQSPARERRTAMYHVQLAMGAVMADADGWQLPLHYGDVSREAAWPRETVGVSDVSPIGKVRVVGKDAVEMVNALLPGAAESSTGSVTEADSPFERGGKLLAARLTPDDFMLLTPAGVAPLAVTAMRSSHPDCAYAIDVTSGLCGVAIAGPATQGMLSRVTEIDTSAGALPDLACVQSRFADVQGLLMRRDVNGIEMFQLYAGREFGEYLWEVLLEAAREVGGGPMGTQALLELRDSA